MMKRIVGLIVGLLLLTGCSEFALLSSGSSLALSNNVYAKAYSGVDLTTYLTTDKDIKTHVYEYIVKAKEVKDLVINTLAHDFSERDNDHIKVASSVEQWEIFEPDESIKLASTKTERITLTIDAFKLCYLSFFLAISIVLLSISLVYLVIYCTRQPAKEKKRKIKRRKRKIKRRKRK